MDDGEGMTLDEVSRKVSLEVTTGISYDVSQLSSLEGVLDQIQDITTTMPTLPLRKDWMIPGGCCGSCIIFSSCKLEA